MFLSGSIGAHRLDEADGADGDQVLDADSGILKPPGDVHHQAQVALNEHLPGVLLRSRRSRSSASSLPAQGRRQCIAAPDVHDLAAAAAVPAVSAALAAVATVPYPVSSFLTSPPHRAAYPAAVADLCGRQRHAPGPDTALPSTLHPVAAAPPASIPLCHPYCRGRAAGRKARSLLWLRGMELFQSLHRLGKRLDRSRAAQLRRPQRLQPPPPRPPAPACPVSGSPQGIARYRRGR